MPGATDQTLRPFLWRAERLYPETEIVSRGHDGLTRYTYSEYSSRVKQLASALRATGVTAGDRVATLCWNHHRHFELYFAVTSMGAQLHTINPLLPTDHISHIIDDAGDRVVFVDPSLVETVTEALTATETDTITQFVVMDDSASASALDPIEDYESYLDAHESAFEWPALEETAPAGMCYTSGTTGKPKGVEYTHQMLWSHTMATQSPQGIPIDDDDVVLPVVPMFHVNAWGMPFSATAGGAKQVFPGPAPEPAELGSLIESEGVTIAAGVPTVWLGLKEYMTHTAVDLSTLERVVIGGSAAPESMIDWFDSHGVEVLHAWGMTEMAPIGTVSHAKAGLEDASAAQRRAKRAKQGLAVPGLEFRVIDDNGDEVPWDGEQFGELWVRGPWVTTEYFANESATAETFEDGWLKTGDVVTVDEDGYLEIVDRIKDVIKSGGEWISSVELENAIMGHDGVEEATVVGVGDDKWQERPIAFVVADDSASRDELTAELEASLTEQFPKWWVPDAFEFIDAVPKTATGKFAKRVLREQYDSTDQFDTSPSAKAPPEE
ncbi:long-chain fatty acid--CoA ligase [Halocatena halophila]|uniref:long-chain fatty acid--CoA ligase n=1 Tax=Halocatena halophila TaxID=2814576 RepID=UPI002ED503B0